MRVGRVWTALTSRSATAVLVVAVSVAVVVMAVTATGNPVNHVSANDGGVWLVNDEPGSVGPGAFGELNVPIGQLASHFADPTPASTYRLDVRQDGATVLAIDSGQGVVYPVDPRTGSPDSTSGITIGTAAQVALGGGVAAVLDPASGKQPGRVWAAEVGTGPIPDLAGLSSKGPATATLAGGSALAVDTAGDVFVASRSQLLELPAQQGSLGRPTAIPFASLGGPISLTTVGTTPVLYDDASNSVSFPETGGSTKLPATAASALLQQSGPSDGSVLLATPTALYGVPLAGGDVTALAKVPAGDGTSTPAAPVRLDGCAYGAWGGSPGYAAQVCPTEASLPTTAAVLPVGAGATVTTPVFRVNNDFIVLNDVASGAAWSITTQNIPIVNPQDWVRLLQADHVNNANNANDVTNQPQQSGKPQLNNPTLYARLGRESTLHVLDRDVDPQGGMLSITSVTPQSGPGFTIQIAPDAQTVIVSLSPGAPSSTTFNYSVVDASGLTASGPVTVDTTTDETAPVLLSAAPAPVHVVSGGTVSVQELGSWRDPESDPISLANAQVPDGQVSWTSDGEITYTAPMTPTDETEIVTYTVTDGTKQNQSTVEFDVLGRGDPTAFPPNGVPDAFRVVVGTPTVLTPLANDVPGADPIDPGAVLALAGPVSSPSGSVASTNTTNGQVTFTAAQAGVYSLTYQAAFGSAISNLTPILVQAVPAPTASEPVTSPISVVLHGQQPTTVDVLNSDYDPAGGILTVVSTSAPVGLQATIEQGRFLRIVANGSTTGTAAPITFDYQVSNGQSAPVDGQITASQLPPPAPTPPVVPTTYATVRAGQEVDIPVLAAATDPDGESMTLVSGGTPTAVEVSLANQGSVSVGAGLGSASVSGGYVRYAAPTGQGLTGPMEVAVSSIVQSASGLRTSAQSVVTVVPSNAPATSQPQPVEVDTRVTAGGTVTIPIPVTGVDSDGEDVTVTGVTSPPALGRILAVTADSITYQAYPSMSGGVFTGGTDRFTYEVTSQLGASAQAVVRVGVTPPAQAQAPVAVDHFATGAPGALVAVDLLADADVSPGDQVKVLPLSQTNASGTGGATLGGADQSVLLARAPSGSASTTLAYGITDGTSTPSIAHVTIRAVAKYAQAPIATDYFPSLPNSTARSVAVDVLIRDSDPGSTRPDLRLVSSSVRGVSVAAADLRIPVTANPRAVPYEISSVTTGATAIGVVYVPGTSTALQAIPGKEIKVPKGGHATVNLTNYVTDAGRPFRLTSAASASASASPASGVLTSVVGADQVTVAGVGSYQGPGSLTVQVATSTGANGASQPVELSIPVQVGNPTPVVSCPTTPLDIIQGGQPVDASVASICSVWTPDNADPAAIRYSATWVKQASDVSLAVEGSGHTVALSAGSGATPGELGQIAIGVAGQSGGATATLNVQVVAAPPPSIGPISVAGVVPNRPVTIDMTQFVTSPLAQKQITVLSISPTDGSAGQARGSGSDAIIIIPAGSAHALTYSVVVGDNGPRSAAGRTVSGVIQVDLLGPPSVPSGLQGVPGASQVALSWNAADPNGSVIDYYTVTLGDGTTKNAPGTNLTWGGLADGTPYTFTVRAHTQVGPGSPSAPITVTPESIPAAPSNVNATGGDGSASVSWTPGASNGASLTGYQISVSPSAGGQATQNVPATQTTYSWTGLSNAIGPYVFRVTELSAQGPSQASAASRPVYAHGVPSTPSAPTAVASISADQTNTTIAVSWPAAQQCNDAQPCAGYVVKVFKDGAPLSSTIQVAGGCGGAIGSCSTEVGPLTNDDSSYAFAVSEVNAEGQSSAFSGQSNSVLAQSVPGRITNLTVVGAAYEINVSFTIPTSAGSPLDHVNYVISGGLCGPINYPSGSTPVTGLAGTTFAFTISVCSGSYTVTLTPVNSRGASGPSTTGATSSPAWWSPSRPIVTVTAPNPLSFTYSEGQLADQITSFSYRWSWDEDPGQVQSGTTQGPGPETIDISGSPMYTCGWSFTVTVTAMDAEGLSDSYTTGGSETPCNPTAVISAGGPGGGCPAAATECTTFSYQLQQSNCGLGCIITLYSNCQTSSTEQASCEAGGQDANGDYAVATFPPGMYVPGTTYGNYEFGYSGAQFWIEAGGATSNRITLPPA